MRSKAKKLEECATLFEIEVPKEKIARAFEDVYAEISRAATIPGFRVGKAPKEVVRKHYEKNAREEVLKLLIPEAYRSALAEHAVNPIGMPEISDLVFEGEEVLSFKAKTETRPAFKLKAYKGIKAGRKKAVVTDEDVDKTLEKVRNFNAKYIAVEERPVQADDYAVSDLECFVEGKPVHKKRENLWLHINRESLMGALTERMVGMAKGEERDIDVALPEKYPDKLLAGKMARYHVKVKEIKSRKLPDLNDELAKDLGKENIQALREAVCSELTQAAEAGVANDMENQVLNRLIEDNDFKVPTSLVKRQLDYMVESAKARLEEKGFARNELDKKDDEFAGRFRDDAVRHVRLLFILDDIAAKENISAGPDDIDGAYMAISRKTGQPVEKVKEYYRKEDLEDGLKDRIKEEKVIKFLLDNAEISEAETER